MKTPFKITLLLIAISMIVVNQSCNDSNSDNSEKEESKKSKVTHQHNNLLVNEKSPYLLQHAHNPVYWYPWGEKAFAQAKKDNKPIFLSIGYATCHWCHVMEKQSFEDDEVAKYLNEHFICIKVDREERPDVDSIYMQACNLINQRGGWPLSCLLNYEKKCFFAGTYFPKKNFMALLKHFKNLWDEKPEVLLDYSQKVSDALKESLNSTSDKRAKLDHATFKTIAKYYIDSYDKEFGGQRVDRNKFPTPHRLTFLLRHYQRTKDPAALEFVEGTLQGMAKGGIHDHLGGGFHRYSTDRQWLLPHFEKMLYDQAQLATAYVEAYQITGKQIYADTADDIFGYVLRKMTHEDGGFFCAEDADSEGVEGKFYYWEMEQIIKLLGPEEGQHFCTLYNIKEKGNFKDPFHPGGIENIPHLKKSLAEVAKSFGIEEKTFKKQINKSRKILFDFRFKRIHPFQDDKILTSWNGLMISALAQGSRVLNNKQYSKAAEKAARFILKRLQKDNRLLRSYRNGPSDIKGYLDDYAFLIHGLIDLYQSSFNPYWLKEANRLSADMSRIFKHKSGALRFTGSDSEVLLAKKISSADNALPSGNSIAALDFLRLGHILSNDEITKKGQKILDVFSMAISSQSGVSHTQMANALDYQLGPRQEIVVAGILGNNQSNELLKSINQHFLPRSIVLFRPKFQADGILSLVPYIKDYNAIKGSEASVYICSDYVCQLPVATPAKVNKLLSPFSGRK